MAVLTALRLRNQSLGEERFAAWDAARTELIKVAQPPITNTVDDELEPPVPGLRGPALPPV